ncbi:MAG: Fic family protein [Deferribacteraceae bacterium]|jgi:cell filamentation protein|nr:Fic family protein [Deferribacteraceae bacterium]
MAQDSKYTMPSGVLINKLGITDAERLNIYEHTLSDARALELKDEPIKPSFDLKHLQCIHQYLFQDVYFWAGELRDVNIFKGNGFCDCRFIVSEADKIFTRLANDQYLRGLDIDAFSKKLAYYFGEINALHPFREGNGRTQRIFIAELAEQAGYWLDFSNISQKEMIEASAASWKGDYAPFETMFAEIVHPHT